MPETEALLTALARRQRHLATAVERLLFLLDAYGAEALGPAVTEAVENGSPHPETVRLILERSARQRGESPQMPIPLPEDPRLQELVVKPHPLEDYDPEDSES